LHVTLVTRVYSLQLVKEHQQRGVSITNEALYSNSFDCGIATL